MGTVEGIRKHGFRKWYERQLIEAHACLVLMVLALLAMAGGYEVLSLEKTAFALLFDGAIVAGSGGLAWYSWRRYALTMTVAEHVGAQASCPGCGHYGFRPVPPAEAAADPFGVPLPLLAMCRRCGTRWPIDPGV
jgi:hypothetical protein